MHIIGRIDITKYKCVTHDIQTDEVIITDERIQHIKERHPDDFEKYCMYMREIIESPEYIIEANKVNTALIHKATPHKARLTALYEICLHIFRHLAQKFLDIRQYACEISIQSDEKSDYASFAQALCGIALKAFQTVKKNSKQC